MHSSRLEPPRNSSRNLYISTNFEVFLRSLDRALLVKCSELGSRPKNNDIRLEEMKDIWLEERNDTMSRQCPSLIICI